MFFLKLRVNLLSKEPNKKLKSKGRERPRKGEGRTENPKRGRGETKRRRRHKTPTGDKSLGLNKEESVKEDGEERRDKERHRRGREDTKKNMRGLRRIST